jgi:hypothetical protein
LKGGELVALPLSVPAKAMAHTRGDKTPGNSDCPFTEDGVKFSVDASSRWRSARSASTKGPLKYGIAAREHQYLVS